MQWLAEVSIKRPVFASVLVLSLVVVGVFSYFNLGVNPANWRTWLATNGPILTRLNVDATWDAASDNKGVLAEYKPRTARGGHAVAIVGYRPGEFIVRNSWGTGWGDKGFAYASDSYAENAFTEAYGVSV